MAIKKANLTKAINSSIGGSVINNGSMDVDGETYIFGDIDSTGSLKVVGTMYSAGEDSKINITSLNGDGKGVQRNAKENTANAQTAYALYAAAAFNRVEINDIRKRIGDVRLTNAPDGGQGSKERLP